MTDLNLNNLRQVLDEYERYANSINSGATAAIAIEILGAVAAAREGLRPSPDSTSNYIEVKQFVERLAALREKAGSAG
jgi:hypothetical protein